MTHPSLPIPREDAEAAARAFVEAGIAASQSDDSANAIALFAQASAAAPAWALPHFLAGSEYAARHDWAAAENALAMAVALDDSFEIARYQYGLLQFTAGKAAQALVTWQPLVQSAESPWLGAFVKGYAMLAGDDFDGARAFFESGLRHAGVNPAVASDIHKMLDGMAAAQRDIDQASAPAADAAVVDAPTASNDTSDASAHVLLSNYDRLKLH